MSRLVGRAVGADRDDGDCDDEDTTLLAQWEDLQMHWHKEEQAIRLAKSTDQQLPLIAPTRPAQGGGIDPHLRASLKVLKAKRKAQELEFRARIGADTFARLQRKFKQQQKKSKRHNQKRRQQEQQQANQWTARGIATRYFGADGEGGGGGSKRTKSNARRVTLATAVVDRTIEVVVPGHAPSGGAGLYDALYDLFPAGRSNRSARAVQDATGKSRYDASSHPQKASVNHHLSLLAARALQFELGQKLLEDQGPSLSSAVSAAANPGSAHSTTTTESPRALPGWALVLDTQALHTVRALTSSSSSSPSSTSKMQPRKVFDASHIIVPNPDPAECAAMRLRTSACVLPTTSHDLLQHMSSCDPSESPHSPAAPSAPKQSVSSSCSPLSPLSSSSEKWNCFRRTLGSRGFHGFSFVCVLRRCALPLSAIDE